jgi:GNAT superfamily N-acetyltransferase
MTFKRAHPHAEMLRLVNLDYDQNMALVACSGDEHREIVGMARYDIDPADGFADIAFVVRDEWQRKGIGTVLMRRMTETAVARGLAGFKADVLLENKAMISVFQKSGLPLSLDLGAGVYHVVAPFAAPPSRSEFPVPLPSSCTQPEQLGWRRNM